MSGILFLLSSSHLYQHIQTFGKLHTMAKAFSVDDLHELRGSPSVTEWREYTKSKKLNVQWEELLSITCASPPPSKEVAAMVIAPNYLRYPDTRYAFAWSAALQHLAEAYCIIEDMKLVIWCASKCTRQIPNVLWEKEKWFVDYWRYMSVAVIAYSRCFDTSPHGK